MLVSVPQASLPPARRRWRPSLLIRLSLTLLPVAVAIVLLWPALWPWALALIVADHLLLTAVGLWPRSTWLGPNLLRLPDRAAARGEIAITIDDGPDPAVTPQVLDCLDLYSARASFFCSAQQAARHPWLAAEIVRRGHSVENHSWRHSYAFALFGFGRLRREIEVSQKMLTELCGRAPQFFRAPAGLRNPLLDPVLARAGLRLTAWTRRGFDTARRDDGRVFRSLARKLAAGDILLLHDGNAARTSAGVPVILAVLPRLLRRCRELDLRPVSLPMACAPDTGFKEG